METVEDFYDALAPRYHVLFEDWWTAAQAHGAVVSRVLEGRGVAAGRVLDVSCGIGTQALPLAARGYRVTGSDVSLQAVRRAADEAAARGIEIELGVHDMRDLSTHPSGGFDAVISCDNAVPHLDTDEDLAAALRGIRRCLRASGWLLVSIRDYDALRDTRPAGVPITVHGAAGARRAFGQSWQWSDDGEHVDIELFTLHERPDGGWQGASVATRCRALRRAVLTQALTAAGFRQVDWLMPEDSGYYQPIVVAQRPA